MTSFMPDANLVDEFKKICKKKFFDIPFVQATEENFGEFGRVVKTPFSSTPIHLLQWPPPGDRGVVGGTEGGVEYGELTVEWENGSCFSKKSNETDSRQICIADGKSVIVHEFVANLHGETLFIPVRETAFTLILSNFFLDECITPLDFVAFHFDGSCGIILYPGIWYQIPLTQDNSSFLYKNAQEFEVFLRIKHPFLPPKGKKIEQMKMIHRDLAKSVLDLPMKAGTCETLARNLYLQSATAESVEPFGKLVFGAVPSDGEITVLPRPGRTKRSCRTKNPEVTPGDFSVEWDYKTETSATNELFLFENGRWSSGGCTFAAGLYHVDKLFSQIDGSYLIFPMESAASYFMILAESDHRGEPISKSLKAFVLSPDQGLLLKPKIWHSRPILSSFKCKELPFLEKHSSVNARMELNVTEECRGFSIQISEDNDNMQF